MAKHTEWKASSLGAARDWVASCFGPDEDWLVFSDDLTLHISGLSRENAYLIAAAPSMLSACELALQDLDDAHSESCGQSQVFSISKCTCRLARHWQKIDAAVAKAIGEAHNAP